MKQNNLPKIYQVTVLIAFIYSVLLLSYAIYNQFFYVDGTWLHGFTSNGFSVLSGLMWFGILFIFKRFLNRILNYSKADVLINAHLIFLGITTLSLANVVYRSIRVYTSLEEGNSSNALTAFATSSISGAIFLFISNFALILICILLGNKIRKMDLVEKKIVQILGYTFIVYGFFSLLGTFGLLGTDIFQFLTKATLSILIGLVIKKVFSMSFSDLNALKDFDNHTKEAKSKPEKTTSNKNKVVKEKPKELHSQNEELPKINLEELEDKELILSYFENLPKEELNRLENIVQNKYNQNLTNVQKQNLVLQYITEKKLYDHQRFLPK
ncbi:hypothetical protein [Flavobacterium sp. J27]|uniref:hypothetical protein n=1 Tax=Flavobacterium sp. J27 TaxID=2060419 RepID=UPI0010310C1F|nr:hypothetical protein [Flavobacterium sp. J27]